MKNIDVFIMLGLVIGFMIYMAWVKYGLGFVPIWFYAAAGMILYTYKLGFMYLRYIPENKRTSFGFLRFLLEFKRTQRVSKDEAIEFVKSLPLFKKVISKPEKFYMDDTHSIIYRLRNNIWYDYNRSFILFFSSDFEEEISDSNTIYLILGIIGFFCLAFLISESVYDLLYTLYLFVGASLLYLINVKRIDNLVFKEAKDRHIFEQKIINNAINHLDSHPDDLKIL